MVISKVMYGQFSADDICIIYIYYSIRWCVSTTRSNMSFDKHFTLENVANQDHSWSLGQCLLVKETNVDGKSVTKIPSIVIASARSPHR